MTSLLKDERLRFPRRTRLAEGSAETRAVRAALASGEPHLLLHARVHGMAGYEERFGPGLTRALRALLGHRVAAVVTTAGRAIAPRPDEFFVLVAAGACEIERWGQTVRAALAPRGRGFTLEASWGAVELPREADRPASALDRARAASVPAPWDREPPRPPVPDLRTAAYGLPLPLEELVRATAERLELGRENIGLVAVAAAVHDAGKAAIPDDVLGKPAALAPAERDLVSLHPRAGETLLRADPALAPAAAIVGALNAPWRTTGVPARILACAVAYEGMTSPRADRPPLSSVAALSELRREAGDRFDPCVVGALIAVLSARAVARHNHRAEGP